MRIDNDPADMTGELQSHVLPGAARVSGFVNAVAHRIIRSNQERLARSGPNDTVRGRSNRERADGPHILVIENRFPVDSAISRLENSPRCRADINDAGIAWFADDGVRAITHGPNETVCQFPKRVLVRRFLRVDDDWEDQSCGN